ncbi:MAG: TlpA family protein disulfide reductase [Cyclobacteriaceae bacterium]|nr:TlpA family protein disulfide reductase [Cyclobacteriaceae bacterium]
MKIAPGAPAPDITLPDSTGTIRTLHGLKGKVVYINFWGTWCGPCIASIPKHIELQESYKDRDDVAFVNVALEWEDDNKWKDFLKEREFPGLHLRAVGAFENKNIVPYLLTGAPSYVLIDKESNVANPMAYPPGYGYTEKAITELLEQ